MEEEKVKVETKDKNKTGMCVAALTLGIISILTNLFWYMSLPTGILAIIFGSKTAKTMGSKLGKAGLVTGIIGVSICIFIYVSIIGLYIASMLY